LSGKFRIYTLSLEILKWMKATLQFEESGVREGRGKTRYSLWYSLNVLTTEGYLLQME